MSLATGIDTLSAEELAVLAEALDLLAEKRSKSIEWAEKQMRLAPARVDHFRKVAEEARADLALAERLLATVEALLPES